MWSYEINGNDLIHPFNTVLEKDVASKGNFSDDLNAFTSQYNVVKCPYIVSNSGNEASETVRLANAQVDISNWRSVLLASSTVGSKVKEIDVHACSLTPQQLQDPALCLQQIGSIPGLKI